MSKKTGRLSNRQMEGDNRQRRALAREARERGSSASQDGVSLGSSKQIGAGGRVPGVTPPGGPPLERPGPTPDRLGTAPPNDPLPRRYREVVGEVARRIGLGTDAARSATDATVAVTARLLGEDDRNRFLDRLPPELGNGTEADATHELGDFIAEVARISNSEPEVAAVRAQAVLSVLADEDRELMESLALPEGVRGLLQPPPAGGGLSGPDGVVGPGGPGAPLTEDQLRAALAELPYWTGTRAALRRTITLPADNLDRVLGQIERLQGETGRVPRIVRDDRENATLVLRNASLNAATPRDVELAHRVDAAIEAAGAGMAS
ncbi:MAG: DUF2267 domain-containing protein [Micromonosporaceae bacterium]|nr:DUF2267 domain-containing protein [Micromonosporaceae bacterium]